MKQRNLVRMLAGGLSVAMLLCGCEFGTPGEGESPSSSESPSESESAPQEDGPTDYSKYNAYNNLADELDDALSVLDAYFANVEYTEEFTLVEGGDYAAIKDAAQFYTANTYYAERALDYAGESPSYPAVDAAVRAMGDSPVELMEAVEDLASYLRFDDFEEDNMAKAAEIHAAIWEPIQILGTYYGEFLNTLSELSDELDEQNLKDLLNDGQMILYYSNVMIDSSSDIMNGILDQIGAANTDPEAEFVLPEVDMTDISPLFAEFMEGYDKLMEAMGNDEEKEKVFTGPLGDSSMELYTSKVNSLYTRMGALADALNQGIDYTDAYTDASEALNGMISGYNGII